MRTQKQTCCIFCSHYIARMIQAHFRITITVFLMKLIMKIEYFGAISLESYNFQ